MSGTHWFGRQTITEIQLQTALALEEAQAHKRPFCTIG